MTKVHWKAYSKNNNNFFKNILKILRIFSRPKNAQEIKGVEILKLHSGEEIYCHNNLCI